MSKDCRDCEFFNGYDYSDGTPQCDCDGGYEACPFNDSSKVVNNGIKIEVDSAFVSDYIRHTIENSISGTISSITESHVKSIISETYKDEIERKTEAEIEKVVSSQISEFMAGDMIIGGGWCEPTKTIPREQYISELVQKKLDDELKGKAISDSVKRIVYDSVEKFSKQLREEVNKSAKLYLDEAVRQTLGESVVSILMGSQPYIQLSEKMKNILPEN